MMKRAIVKSAVLAAFCVTFLAGGLFAYPIGNQDAGRKYLIAARDLTPWSAGVHVKSGRREARVDSVTRDIDFTRAALYVGYDFVPWVTTFVKAGANNTSLDGRGEDDYSLELGFGMRANLLHHEIMDPTLFEDRIMINASWEFSNTEASRHLRDQSYRELQASLTLSIVNDLRGDKLYFPHSISLFFGPTFSLVDTSGASMRNEMGLVAGLEVFTTKRVFFRLAAEQIGDSSSVLFGLHANM